MLAGRVKWFDQQKGFGFVSPDGGGPDVFVHQSVLPEGVQTLREGAAIQYELETTPRGAKVVKIQLS